MFFQTYIGSSAGQFSGQFLHNQTMGWCFFPTLPKPLFPIAPQHLAPCLCCWAPSSRPGGAACPLPRKARPPRVLYFLRRPYPSSCGARAPLDLEMDPGFTNRPGSFGQHSLVPREGRDGMNRSRNGYGLRRKNSTRCGGAFCGNIPR